MRGRKSRQLNVNPEDIPRLRLDMEVMADASMDDSSEPYYLDDDPIANHWSELIATTNGKELDKRTLADAFGGVLSPQAFC